MTIYRAVQQGFARPSMRVLVVVLVAAGATFVGAQTFSRDTQFIARPPRSVVDDSSLDRQALAELVSHMHAQEVINAQQIAAMAGVEKRIQRIEEIKPDTVSIRLTNLESSSETQQRLLWGILVAVLANFASAWMKRKDQGDS